MLACQLAEVGALLDLALEARQFQALLGTLLVRSTLVDRDQDEAELMQICN